MKRLRACAICNASFAQTRHGGIQLTCSRRCGAIWRVKYKPQAFTMHAANAVRRANLLAKRMKALEALSKVECYNLGKRDGYSVGYQRRVREIRKSA